MGSAEAHLARPAIEHVAERPTLGAGLAHAQIKPATVTIKARLRFPRNLECGKFFRLFAPCSLLTVRLTPVPQITPQTVRELYRTAGNSGNGKVRKTTAISVGYRTVANYGEQCTGGAGGIRTLDTPLERITV